MIAPVNFTRRRRRLVTLEEKRRRFIREHSAFLTWAMQQEQMGRPLPRIPRKRVDQGGWGATLGNPGGRALINRWWKRMCFEARWRFC